MLNSDMGLYLDFEVDEVTGRQIGTLSDGTVSCPGIVDADKNAIKWKNGQISKALKGYSLSRIHTYSGTLL